MLIFLLPVELFKNLEPLIGPGSTQFRNGEYGQKMRKMADRYFSHGKLLEKLSMFQQVQQNFKIHIPQIPAINGNTVKSDFSNRPLRIIIFDL